MGLGQALHQLDEVVPTAGLPLDDLLAVALLIWFGASTLRGAAGASEAAADERGEAQRVVAGMGGGAATLGMVASTFTLVFAAEWGDKSFLATIALAAASSPVGATRRGCCAHLPSGGRGPLLPCAARLNELLEPPRHVRSQGLCWARWRATRRPR